MPTSKARLRMSKFPSFWRSHNAPLYVFNNLSVLLHLDSVNTTAMRAEAQASETDSLPFEYISRMESHYYMAILILA